MSALKQVLAAFQDTSQPMTIAQIGRQLDIDLGMLEDMIAFWVRKGRLRDLNQCADNCGSCGSGSTCPFIVNMPRRYEFVAKEDAVPVSQMCMMDAGCRKKD